MRIADWVARRDLNGEVPCIDQYVGRSQHSALAWVAVAVEREVECAWTRGSIKTIFDEGHVNDGAAVSWGKSNNSRSTISQLRDVRVVLWVIAGALRGVEMNLLKIRPCLRKTRRRLNLLH